MTTPPVPLSELTLPQRRRVRCLEVASTLLAGHQPELKMRVAVWLFTGRWGEGA